MAKVVYQPNPEDNDHTEVAGVKFNAFEPVEVADSNAELIASLKRNPWFKIGDPDPDRMERWSKVRDVQAEAKAHREHADEIEKHPEKAATLRAHMDDTVAKAQRHADDIRAGARADADDIIAKAEAEAAKIIADAKAERDKTEASGGEPTQHPGTAVNPQP